MGAKRVILGTLVGALTLSATGYLIFGVVFPTFYTDFLNAGSASGVERQPLLVWAIALAMLSNSLLVTLAVGNQTGRLTIGRGMMIGSVVNFLLWFTADFALYAISNIGNLTGIVVDSLLELVPGAVAGGAVAFVLGKIPVASAMRDSRDVNAGQAA